MLNLFYSHLIHGFVEKDGLPVSQEKDICTNRELSLY